ncbi:hypothetical protein Zmor_011084 [Zophobas morio]|uniref:Uncharacterized protein n=1 Tax=Zophobas morio TaxID=2755281 RepID=A0AA38MKJ6_9CUCU|nr:hypothetical protein Zmor_011084 [Zophobas morio]
MWAPGTSQTRLSCSITSSKEKHTTQISSTKYVGKLNTAITLGDVLAGKNKASREVKIGSFTKGSGPTIPGNINGTCVAITIDTGAEVSLLRRLLLVAKNVMSIPETIRLKIGTPIMGEAEVEICISQLKIKHRTTSRKASKRRSRYIQRNIWL